MAPPNVGLKKPVDTIGVQTAVLMDALILRGVHEKSDVGGSVHSVAS